MVDQAIADSIGDGSIADDLEPASHGQLGSEDGGTAPDPIFQHLQQGEPGRAIKVLETKIVKDDHIGSGDLVDLFEVAAIGYPEPGLREENLVQLK